MLSDRWARILVRAYGCSRQGRLPEVVAGARRVWDRWLGHYLRGREAAGRPLQWFEEPGLAHGAFATLLGLTLGPRTWSALAVGDSCLLHLRTGRLELAFPVAASVDFGRRPLLLASNPAHGRGVKGYSRWGYLRPGDCFCLATDALACYLLQQLEAGSGPDALLEALRHDFAGEVARLRGARRLRNDDVTLVVVEISAGV
jgi:hypothetical protein